jgi:hypothetical protein
VTKNGLGCILSDFSQTDLVTLLDGHCDPIDDPARAGKAQFVPLRLCLAQGDQMSL